MLRYFINLLMFITVVPLWAHDFEVNGYFYKITSSVTTNRTVAITYKGSNVSEYTNEYSGAISIPSSVTYNGISYKVTSIDQNAFKYCTDVTSVSIPNSVTSIGQGSFCSTSITTITVPNSVTEIGDDAFNSCSKLKTAYIDASIIKANAFYYATNLTEVTLGSNVTQLMSSVFADCNLKKVTIEGNTNPTIEDSAFKYGLSTSGAILIVPDGRSTIFTSKTACSVFKHIIEASKVITSIKFYGEIVNCEVGDTYEYDIICTPTNAAVQEYNWVSSNPSVATVDSNGKVVALSRGETTISATTTDGSNLTIKDSFIVMQPDVIATSINLNQTTANLNIGELLTLSASILPETTTDKSVTWSSSDKSIASVENGVVTAIAPGKATITATTADGSNLSASCEITVVAPAATAEVSMYIDDFSIKGGETKTIAINLTNNVDITAFQCDVYLPEGLSFVYNEDEESYNWLNYDRASKKHVYEGAIQADGALRSLVYHLSSTAFKENSGEILYFDVKADDSFSGEHSIELKNVECTQPDATKILPGSTTCTVTGEVSIVLATSIVLDQTDASILIGETLTLTATVLPETTTDKSVIWSSSDKSIASVENGVVTAIAPGKATITATTADGSNLSATCEIEVLPTKVTSITLNQTTASLNIGETLTLTTTLLPEDATNKNVTWSCSDEAIATVENGVVTAIAPGKATITATTADGSNLSASCEITVVAPATTAEVSMYIDDFSIKGGETKTIAINLTNNVDITAFQCDVYLPEGLSFVYNEDEESYNWLNYDRAAKKHVYEGAIQADGALRSLVYHLSSTAFKENSGEILYFDVKADNSFSGEHTIELKNVECTQPDATKILPASTTCTVTGGTTGVMLIDGSLQMRIYVNGNTLNVAGAEDAQIAVYSINGDLIYQGVNRPVAVANKGVYVVIVNGVAVKVML